VHEDGHAVEGPAHVDLNGIGTELACLPDTVDAVLGGVSRARPVCDDNHALPGWRLAMPAARFTELQVIHGVCERPYERATIFGSDDREG